MRTDWTLYIGFLSVVNGLTWMIAVGAVASPVGLGRDGWRTFRATDIARLDGGSLSSAKPEETAGAITASSSHGGGEKY